MASCLTELIGVQHPCGTINPAARYFINEAAGITVQTADRAANEEQQDGLSLIQEKIELAAKIVEDTIAGEIQKQLTANTVVSNQIVGFYQDNPKVIAPTNQLKGLRVYIENDQFLELYIDSITAIFDTTLVGAEIKLYDLNLGLEIDSFTFDSIAGSPVSISINKTFRFDRQQVNLAFLYDASLVSTYQTAYNSALTLGCLDCPHSSNFRSGYLYARGIQIDPVLPKITRNVKGTLGTNGLIMSYSIQCGYKAFLCNMRNQFAWPMFNKVSELLYRELYYSKRLNSVILYDRDAHEALMNDAASEFERSIRQIVKGLRIPDTVCVSCKKPIRQRVHIP